MRNRLIQLFADNSKAELRTFAVRAAASQPDTVEILLYDAIVSSELEAEWWGGVAPESFVKAVRSIEASTIHLRINSPGGDVFAARAMEQALREHSAKVVVHIDGLAASAASFLAMAGDEIVIAKGAMVMIHKAWTLAYGNAAELNKTAALLDKIDGTLVQTYVDRTGQKADQVAQWMADETWFTAQEAVDFGFADQLADAGADPKAQTAWNLRAYLRAPSAVETSAPPATDPTPPAAADHATPDRRDRQRQRCRLLEAAPIE